MSAIEKELQTAVEVTPKRGEEKESYLKRLIQAVSELPDADWNKLSKPAMVWFNDSADALGAKKDIPAFPDAEEEKKEDAPRRRGTAKEETKEEAADPKVGDKVTVVTKRDKTIKGELVEVTKDLYVIKEGDGEETEIAIDRVKSIEVDAPTKEEPKKSRRRSADEDEEQTKKDPEVDDVIDATTARGKEVSGKVIEIGDDLIVIVDGDGEELELTPSTLKSLTIREAKKEETTSRRRKSADDEEGSSKSKKDDKETKRTSSKANGGVSVTMRIRELIVLDPEAKAEAIGKSLTKEGLEFRANTLDLVYADTHKVLELCRKHKLIK